MDFKISFRPDLDYYKEAYSEMIKGSWLKRLEPVFAIVMILFSVGLWYFDINRRLGFFPLFFGAIGVFEFVKVYVSRAKWLKDRVRSGVTGQEIHLRFTDDFIIHNGPFSNGNIKWEGLKSIRQTGKGLIIKPETGTVIYLPKGSFESKEQIDLIISKERKKTARTLSFWTSV
jgi:hypothetical protein